MNTPKDNNNTFPVMKENIHMPPFVMVLNTGPPMMQEGAWWAGLTHCVSRLDKSLIN